MIMKKLTDLEYLRLNTLQRLWYNIVLFVLGIPGWLASLVKAVGNGIAGAFRSIRNELTDCATTFTRGSWKTKVSYLVMGFGNIARGQVLRGLLFLVFEAVFIVYMVTTGSYWLGKFRTLGDVPPGEVYNEVLDTYVRVNGDDSFKILLYGLLTILFIIAFVYTWRLNVKQNRISEEILATGKKIKSGKDDLRSVLDDQFHKTLLALPITGILVFTVIPILFMILVAFTNYDGAHDGYSNLFTWVGLSNFNDASITAVFIGTIFSECNSNCTSLLSLISFSNIINPFLVILYLYCLPLISFTISLSISKESTIVFTFPNDILHSLLKAL